MIIGSYFASDNIFETRDVIVVFPCEPEIIILLFRFNKCASISALFIICIFLLLANFNSLLLDFIAVEITTILEFNTDLVLWP